MVAVIKNPVKKNVFGVILRGDEIYHALPAFYPEGYGCKSGLWKYPRDPAFPGPNVNRLPAPADGSRRHAAMCAEKHLF